MRQTTVDAETWQVQYAAILAVLEEQAAATGSLGIAAGGRAVRISRVAPPSDLGSYPAIGVQFARRSNRVAANRIREQTNFFDITVSWDQPFDVSVVDIDRAAKEQIEKLLNDGNGHGLLPLLNADIRLRGTAMTSIDTDLVIYLGRSEDEDAGISGRAYINFSATAEQVLLT